MTITSSLFFSLTIFLTNTARPRHFLNNTNHFVCTAPNHLFTLAGLLWKGVTLGTEASGSGPKQRRQIMSQASSSPNLSPQFCFSFGTLRDFLRLSRSSVDDSIAQNLNALVTPAQEGFDPVSTSQRALRASSRQIDSQACQDFRDKVLFPSWKARTEVLDYCGIVATSPDPDDPETAIRELENQKDRRRVVDERLDPYSGRFFPREARTQTLALLIRQERGVESIVRSRTWSVTQDRCRVLAGQNWEDAMAKWEDAQSSKQAGSSQSTPR